MFFMMSMTSILSSVVSHSQTGGDSEHGRMDGRTVHERWPVEIFMAVDWRELVLLFSRKKLGVCRSLSTILTGCESKLGVLLFSCEKDMSSTPSSETGSFRNEMGINLLSFMPISGMWHDVAQS